VRPLGDRFEILSGHHRRAAALDTNRRGIASGFRRIVSELDAIEAEEAEARAPAWMYGDTENPPQPASTRLRCLRPPLCWSLEQESASSVLHDKLDREAATMQRLARALSWSGMSARQHLRPDCEGQRAERAVQLAFARDLVRIYADVLNDPMPPDLARLIERLERQAGKPQGPSPLSGEPPGRSAAVTFVTRDRPAHIPFGLR
jgi:hypothetical protein